MIKNFPVIWKEKKFPFIFQIHPEKLCGSFTFWSFDLPHELKNKKIKKISGLRFSSVLLWYLGGENTRTFFELGDGIQTLHLMVKSGVKLLLGISITTKILNFSANLLFNGEFLVLNFQTT